MTTSDPRVPERWRLGDHFVPKGRYCDRDFLHLEYERIFGHTWQMACRLEEVEAPGDFVEYRIGRESIVVVRGDDHRVRAFHNTCPHRGTRLAQGEGSAPEFVCPFHAWRFDLTGACTWIQEPGDFGGKLRTEDVHLVELRVDDWGGFVFVHMDPEPPALSDWLDPLPGALAAFELERMRFGWYKTAIMPANWKTVIDAFIEGYHTGARHPQNLRRTRLDRGPASLEELAAAPYTPSFALGNHSRFLFGPRPVKPEEALVRTVDPNDYERLIAFTEYNAFKLLALATERDVRAARRLRGETFGADRTAFQVFQALRAEEAEADGIRWPKISAEEYAAGQGNWHAFPNLVLLVEPGCALGYRVRPNGDDPDSCIFDAWTLELVPEGDTRRAPHEVFDDWRDHENWGDLLPQDFENFPDVTAGMHSSGFRGLRLNPKQEAGVFNHHRAADRLLFGAPSDERNRGDRR